MARIIGENTRPTGSLTLDRHECSQACPGNTRLSEPESDKAVTTTVYVRHGRLLRFEGKNPDEREARAVLEPLKNWLEERRADYVASIAQAIGVSVSKVKPLEDRAKLGLEGDALVLDCQLLQISGGKKVVEMRVCFAICTAKASTKVWARVSMPLDDPEQSVRVEMNDVSALCEQFRPIADAAVKWGCDRMEDMRALHLKHKPMIEEQYVRTTSLGIQDPKLATQFERLYEAEMTAAKLFADDIDLDKRLTSYCQRVSGIDESNGLTRYTRRPWKGRVAWFKMPLHAVLAGGEIVPRVVLYLMREVGEDIEIIGLAYDDSERGDIVVRSGAALAQVVGPWM